MKNKDCEYCVYWWKNCFDNVCCEQGRTATRVCKKFREISEREKKIRRLKER